MFSLDFEMYSGDSSLQNCWNTVWIVFEKGFARTVLLGCIFVILLSEKSFIKSRPESHRTIWPYENVIALVQWTVSENTNLLLNKN